MDLIIVSVHVPSLVKVELSLLTCSSCIKANMVPTKIPYGHTTLKHPRSRQISEAKQGRPWLVLGWEISSEDQVL